LVHTSHDWGNADGTKDTSGFSYYLIVVHEEVDDECAHAQLIADIILLRYKGTSLTMSSETTRALLKTESWVTAWLEFFFQSTLSFLLDVGDEHGRTVCSTRNGIDGRDGLCQSGQS
jgi:hypothetical protein